MANVMWTQFSILLFPVGFIATSSSYSHFLFHSIWFDVIWYDRSHHSIVEHRASTRILHLTLFLASVLISAQIFLTPLATSSSVIRHVFVSLPLARLPWGFHSRACLAILLDGFHSVWPSHPHLQFLICIYSRLLLALPQLFIRNLVQPENSHYFP